MYQRFGQLKGLRLSYIGDGNNVLHSLLLLAPFVGVDVHYACPEGNGPDEEILARANARGLIGGGKIRRFQSAAEAVAGTHAVYTDVWTSMGATECAERIEKFTGFQLNLELFSKALPVAIALHCLPMVKGQEITADVVEHPRSALFQQSENRLHAQKALLTGLFHAKQKTALKELAYSHVI
jgi:ornithine carbamoyltransferase